MVLDKVMRLIFHLEGWVGGWGLGGCALYEGRFCRVGVLVVAGGVRYLIGRMGRFLRWVGGWE